MISRARSGASAKSCGHEFMMAADEIRLFQRTELDLPKRCRTCCAAQKAAPAGREGGGMSAGT
jgi:hypothetical protein